MRGDLKYPPRTSQSPKVEAGGTEAGMHYDAEPEPFVFAKELGQKETKSENILWNRIKNRQLLGLKFRRQHPINKYIADFYCHEVKYVIELDGEYHSDLEQAKYDFNRDAEMRELGIYVKRIKNDFILLDLENTINEISSNLQVRGDHLL
jgi:very-short-patch-repair endonuclease